MSRDRHVNRHRDTLDEIEIASPCTVPWNDMRGDDRVRFCGQCRQNVYNVEALGREEARRLVREREGRMCVRILRRDDGTVVTADCWTRLRAARRRGIACFLATLLVVGWAELVAIRFGLQALRRIGARPPTPAFAVSFDRSLVPATRLTGVRGPRPPEEIAPPRKTARPRSRARAPQPTAGHYTAGTLPFLGRGPTR